MIRDPRAKVSALRGRFNHLAAAVGEARELSRQAALTAQALRGDLVSLAQAQTQLALALDQLAVAAERIEAVQAAEAEIAGRWRGEVLQGLRRVHADEAWHRRRLREVRQTAEYELAYTEPEPLVSVIIATYNRLDVLRARALPSILAQEYRNFEIVIVGDQAPYGLAEISEGFGDAPIRFANLPMRGPYPDETEQLWMVAGVPPFNEAMHLARGSWVAGFSDDDAMRPNHLKVLLEGARERRLELVYGRLQDHYLGTSLGTFPPRVGQLGLQAALVHGQLGFYELELSDADFRMPSDWGRIDRMLRTGVRFGMVNDIVADYYPSLRGLGQ
jgi:hypothetical protein